MPVRTEALMGTLVTIRVVCDHTREQQATSAMGRAFGWFHYIESRCTRFDPQSELMQLTQKIGEAVPLSDILWEAVRFALTVAEESGGAFDPTVGHGMETHGFNREYRSGAVVRTDFVQADNISYRDVLLDPDKRTITLRRPLLLDLGAVAKGLAVDMAARELQPFTDFCIDAGGDLYLSGANPDGNAWSVGIRHPRREGELIDQLLVSNAAVCTSGDYERRASSGRDGQHILDPRKNSSPLQVASATVVASNAMLADALATAAFVLGTTDGIDFLHRSGVEGLIITNNLERYETSGWGDARQNGVGVEARLVDAR